MSLDLSILPQEHPFSQWLCGLPEMSSLRPYQVCASVQGSRYVFKWMSLHSIREIQRIIKEEKHLSAECRMIHEAGGPQSCTMIVELIAPRQLYLPGPGDDDPVDVQTTTVTATATVVEDNDDAILNRASRPSFLAAIVPAQGCYQQFSY